MPRPSLRLIRNPLLSAPFDFRQELHRLAAQLSSAPPPVVTPRKHDFYGAAKSVVREAAWRKSDPAPLRRAERVLARALMAALASYTRRTPSEAIDFRAVLHRLAAQIASVPERPAPHPKSGLAHAAESVLSVLNMPTLNSGGLRRAERALVRALMAALSGAESAMPERLRARMSQEHQ